MIVPPTPGNVSCAASRDFRSVSMPADSSKPFTTIASVSCSVSKILTSFLLGVGWTAGESKSGMASSVRIAANRLRQLLLLCLVRVQKSKANGSLHSAAKVAQWQLKRNGPGRAYIKTDAPEER